ncbi:peptide MFS transporter [Amycolatopsis sp. lyj-90]|uniref:peptide MFS transporter n=1 Tax=Amycolatopsis sp. lyj-90 TaxID=2789285 RepID=UPI00397CB751
MAPPIDQQTPAPAAAKRRRFDYPRWFVTLFFTDIWERFSFYGMMAVLTLYAAAPSEEGGLGLPKTDAAALFGAYIGLVFVLSLPGGWIGDRILGYRRATIMGGVLIALGHYSMAVPTRFTSYLGLILIALGTGLLKPNMLALLSSAFGSHERAKREAAFSIFYVSIQVSALLAPLIVGFLAENYGWHWGFSAAAVGMTFGVAQFVMGAKHFGESGRVPQQPATTAQRRRIGGRAAAGLAVVSALLIVDVFAGTFTPMHLIGIFAACALFVPFIYFLVLLRSPEVGQDGRKRLRPFFWLLLSFSLFWMLAAQTGALLSLFARQSTDRSILGFELPVSWFQSAVPFFILLTAPVFAWLWVRLGHRFGTAAKFGLALLLAAGAFIVMSPAAALALDGKVSPLWLVAAFFLIACGEVIIGPIGLATAAEVVSSAFTGRTIGLIWLFSALGAGLGSQVVHLSDVLPHYVYYLSLGLLVGCAGTAVICARRSLNPTRQG